MKKIVITLISSILIVSFLIGFIEVSEGTNKINNDEIIYSVPEIPNDFKSVGSLDKRTQDIVAATSRGLVELNSNNEIKPSLSESVEISEDGLQYDFKIRDDVYWSDGTKITPKDIATFFREILIEENEESIAALLNVYGAKNYRAGEGIFSKDVGISYTEDRIIFRLNSQDDKFIEELTTPQYRLRKNVIMWENLINSYDELIYSGYYSIESISLEEIKLKRNEDIDTGITNEIKIVFGEDEELAMASFEIGGRDIVINPPKSQLNRLQSEGRLISLNSNRTMYIAFNPKDSTLELVGRREIYKLLNKAIEEYQLKNNIYMELAEGSYFRNDKDDLAKLQARKVMNSEEVQWEKPNTIHMIAEESSENKEICDFLVSWFEEKEGISLIYDLISKEEMNSINEVNYYNFALIEGELSLVDENSIYDKIINFLDSSNKEKLLFAKTEGDKYSSFINIEEELYNNFRVLPLVFFNDTIAINKDIKNISLDGNGNISFVKIENNKD